MKVAFLLLAHENPSDLKKILVKSFYQNKDLDIFIHIDKKSKFTLNEYKKYFTEYNNLKFINKRFKAHWGDISLVDATVELIRETKLEYDFYYLLSGSCLPVRNFKSLQDYLRLNSDKSFIEFYKFGEEEWIKDGLKEERFNKYFIFNYQTNRLYFEKFLNFQRKYKINRKFDKEIYLGSQWFCINKSHAEIVMQEYKNYRKFFKFSWIPDESCIQSIIGNNVEKEFLNKFNLTFYSFNNSGIPILFNDDINIMNYDFQHFFIRKIDHNSKMLDDYKLIDKTKLDNDINLNKDHFHFKKIEFDLSIKKNANQSIINKISKDVWRGYLDVINNYTIFTSTFYKTLISVFNKNKNNKTCFGLFLFDDDLLSNYEKELIKDFGLTYDLRRKYPDLCIFLLNSLKRSENFYFIDQRSQTIILDRLIWSDGKIYDHKIKIKSFDHLKNEISSDDFSKLEKKDIIRLARLASTGKGAVNNYVDALFKTKKDIRLTLQNKFPSKLKF